MTEVPDSSTVPSADGSTPDGLRWRSPDWRRMLQLMLAALWLLDGVLQLQPFFFTAGKRGFSGMLAGTAHGNPGWIAHSIMWNASVVDHHAAASDAAFALVQILLAFGIAWRPTTKPALGASVLWSLAVWWFGEGLGGLFTGTASPIGGGPGAVLFYALLAVLLWPADRAGVGSRPGFAAARFVGTSAARALWVVVWVGLAGLVLGPGRSPQGVHDLITGLEPGQPGWLAAIDRHAASAFARHGLAVALAFALVCLIVAAAVFLPPAATKAALVLAIVAAAALWVVGENFGMILPGGATDPNSGPLLILLALSYWPTPSAAGAGPHRAARPDPTVVAAGAV